LGTTIIALAQGEYKMKGNNDYTEIDILSSYYNQDGDNGAVTGGVGTEALTDVATLIVINIPKDSTKALNYTFGADYYTSASTDNIDNNPSSASSKDIRAFVNVGYSKLNLSKATTYGIRLGISREYDYTSFNGGINFAKEFYEGNSQLSLNAQVFVDQWGLYFPVELRGNVTVPTTSRNSYDGQITWSQVINKKLQIAISGEVIYMNGLLSTPFHRVFFADQDTPDIERLPSTRLKIPLSIRSTWFALERLVVRSYYRFYTDDFGINAHTVNIDLPFKISDSFTATPFYRYHTQTGSDYFAPFAVHNSTQEFYTSDYDLSDLSSHKYGLAVGYSPLYGLARMRMPFSKRAVMFNSLILRGARYSRDTGLSAYSFAFEASFRM